MSEPETLNENDYVQNYHDAAVKIQKAFRSWREKKVQVVNKPEPQIIDEIAKKLLNRKRVAEELLQTEQLYVKNLNIVVTGFMNPMQYQSPALAEKYIRVVFGNIKDITFINNEILAGLEKAMTDWTPEKPLMNVFLKNLDFLKLYSIYCATHHIAIRTLAKKEKQLMAFLKKCQIDYNIIMDLPSYLIMPVQRVPRYKLLFEQLLKYTPETYSDYEYTKIAVEKVSIVALQVNESIRENETQLLLEEMEKKFIGNPIVLVKPGRRPIKEGLLTKVCRKENKKRYFWLFNDILIYGVKLDDFRFRLHNQVDLENSQCHIVSEERFEVLSKSKSFTILVENPKERDEWVSAILQSIADPTCRFVKLQTEHEESIEPDIAPVWMPDSTANSCTLCHTPFTVIRRRHHCRRCGKLVCGSCSSQKWRLENMNKKLCRVCDECFTQLSSGHLSSHYSISPSPSSVSLMSAQSSSSSSSNSSNSLAVTSHHSDSSSSLDTIDFTSSTISNLSTDGTVSQKLPITGRLRARDNSSNPAPVLKEENEDTLSHQDILNLSSSGDVSDTDFIDTSQQFNNKEFSSNGEIIIEGRIRDRREAGPIPYHIIHSQVVQQLQSVQSKKSNPESTEILKNQSNVPEEELLDEKEKKVDQDSNIHDDKNTVSLKEESLQESKAESEHLPIQLKEEKEKTKEKEKSKEKKGKTSKGSSISSESPKSPELETKNNSSQKTTTSNNTSSSKQKTTDTIKIKAPPLRPLPTPPQKKGAPSQGASPRNWPPPSNENSNKKPHSQPSSPRQHRDMLTSPRTQPKQGIQRFKQNQPPSRSNISDSSPDILVSPGRRRMAPNHERKMPKSGSAGSFGNNSRATGKPKNPSEEPLDSQTHSKNPPPFRPTNKPSPMSQSQSISNKESQESQTDVE